MHETLHVVKGYSPILMSTSFLVKLADLERAAKGRLKGRKRAARRSGNHARALRVKSLRDWGERVVARPRYAD